MRNTLRRSLSLALAVVMAVSCLVAIPAAAENAESGASATTGAAITENSQGTLLWSADFNDSDLTTNNLWTKYKTKFVAGFGDGTAVGNMSISNGNLKLSGNTSSIVPNISISGDTITWNDTTDINDDVYNLFSGNYYRDGERLTNYYFDFDFTLGGNRPYISESSNSKTYSYTKTDGTNVSYKVSHTGVGESLFTVMTTGTYTWIMKVTQDGYVYTSSTNATNTFDPTSTNNDWEHFTVTKTEGNTTEYTHKELTADEWAAIQSEFESNGGTLTEVLSVGNACNYNSKNVYKLESGVTYNFRYTFDVESSTNKVTINVYVRPKNCDGSAWQRIGNGALQYVPQSKYLRPTSTSESTSTPLTSTVTGSKVFFAIRLKESYSDTYLLDNMKFCTWSTDECTESSHSFLVGSAAKLSDDGKTLSSLGFCQQCGNAYCLTGKAETSNYLIDLAHNNLTKDALNGYLVEDYKNKITPNDGTITLNQADIRISDQNEETQDFWLEFDATFSGSRGSAGDNTFLALMTHSTDYGKVMFRYIGNSIYLRTGETSSYPEKLIDITQNTHYLFKIHVEPEFNSFNALVYTYDANGNVKKEPDVNKRGYIAYTTQAGEGGYPAFRIGFFNITGSVTTISQYTEKYVLDKAEPLITTSGFTTALDSLASFSKFSLGQQADGTFAFGNVDINESATICFKSDKLTTDPTLISFDFMVDDALFDTANASETQFWNVLGYVAPNNSCYYCMLRLGGVDSNGDGKFEKIFFTSDSTPLWQGDNNRYTTGTNTGYQTTTAGGDTYYTDRYALYTLTPGEWVRITASIDPSKSAHGFIIDDRVLSPPIGDWASMGLTTPQDSYIRIGDAFRKFKYSWNIKNVNVSNSDAEKNVAAWNNLSNVIWKSSLIKASTDKETRFGDFSFSSTSTTTDANGYTIFRTKNFYTADESVAAVGDLGGTRLDVSLSDKMAGTNGDVTHYHVLEGKKYALSLNFALNKDAEWKQTSTTSETGYTNGGAQMVTVFRLSKYIDGNKAILLYDGPSTGFRANAKINGSTKSLALYNAKGEMLTAWTTISDNGPEKWTTATAVVDEAKNTFSVYIDGNVAYYKNGNVLTPAVDLTMVVQENNANTTKYYKDVNAQYDATKTDARSRQYLRILQNTTEAYVKEASISLIKDDAVELIGTQTRNTDNAETTFDLRFVFALDNLFVNDVQYKVAVKIGDTDYSDSAITRSSKNVYSSIVNGNGTLKAIDYTQGNYLSCFEICGITKADVENQTVTFTITPYTVQTYSSTPVAGETYTVTLQYTSNGTTITYNN